MNHPNLYNTFNNTIVKGGVNPIRRDAIYTNIHCDSKYRDNYYNSSASDFLYTLPQPIDNIVSLKLNSIAVPNAWYVFSKQQGNNRFVVDVSGEGVFPIVIPDGNYSATELATYLNFTYFSSSGVANGLRWITFTIDPQSCKSGFEIDSSAPAGFSIDVSFVTSETKHIMYGAGWILGFRYAQYTNINVAKPLVSEGLYDGDGDRYFYFCLNDFNKNVTNHNIVYFDDSTMRDDVLAKIYLKDGKCVMNIDNTPDDCCNHLKTRRYFGPIDLNKFHVKLIDQYGRVLDLNNMDYSFSLELEQKYKD